MYTMMVASTRPLHRDPGWLHICPMLIPIIPGVAELQPEDGSVGLPEALPPCRQREAQHGGAVLQHEEGDRGEPWDGCQDAVENDRVPGLGWASSMLTASQHKNTPKSQCISSSSLMLVSPWTFLWTVITPELKSSLVKVLGLLKDAAESFSKVHQRFCILLCCNNVTRYQRGVCLCVHV